MRVRIEASATPDPGLLRGALRARLAGRGWPAGLERSLADQVRAEVTRAQEGSSWR